VLSGELGVSQGLLARWYVGGGYMDVSELVVFYVCGKIYVQNKYPWPVCGESVSSCKVMLQVAEMNMDVCV